MTKARSPALAPMVAGALLIALVSVAAAPAIVQILRAVTEGFAETAPARFGWTVIARTIWAPLLIGVIATALALPASWWLRRASAGATALLLAPLFLPSFLVYASWGLLRAPGSWLGDRVATASSEFVRLVSDVQAIGGLSLWAWPLAAVALACWTRRVDQDALDALRSVGASAWRVARFVLYQIRWGLATSVGVVALLMLGSAIPLHVAQVETYTIALWRLIDETGGAPSVWLLATPLVAIAIVGGAMLSTLASRTRPPQAERAAPAQSPLSVKATAASIWAISTLAPLVILLLSLRNPNSLGRFWTNSAEALSQSALVAALVAIAVLSIGVLTSMALSSPSGVIKRVVLVTLAIWLALAIVPGVLIGEATLRIALLSPLTGWLADSVGGVVLAHTARFGFLGVGAVVVMHALEARELTDLRALHAPGALRSWRIAVAPRQALGIAGGAVAAFALSMHEIEAAVMVMPPGADNLPRHLLNLLHYNRQEELTAASVWMLLFGLALGATVICLSRLQWSRLTRSRAALLLVTCAAAMPGACDRSIPQGEPIRVTAVIGEAGRSAGQFLTPRAIDAGGGFLWVIDRSGRMQRIDPASGDAITWEMPAHDNGFPCGVTYGPDGLLYVADTHEQRVVVFRPTEDGAEIVRMIGSYGTEGGQFIYPTDVAIATTPDGAAIERFYVSEYGGNDRVSVFDADWNFLLAFGKEGTGAGVEFARPQSLCFDPIRRELLVVDATNHRVGRFTPDGDLLTWHGAGGPTPGEALGEFRYPYGCAMLPDGSVLVLEFGGNRVQRIDWETGEGLGAWGTPGRNEGELAQPWGVAVLDGVVYVADAGNQRIQAFNAPAPALRPRSAP